MKDNGRKWAVKSAGAGALVLMLAVPAFAQSRGERDRNSRGNDRNDRGRTESSQRDRNRSYRDNERVSVQGKVSSFSRERDGYRVHLDRGRESYWVPQSYFRNRGRDLRVGVAIVLGGVFRGGSIYVDAVSWPGDRGGYYGDRRDGYYDDYVAGIVQYVDYRRGVAEIRDQRSGRTVRVDFRRDDRGRLGFDDVRRGDYVELSGRWSGGVFDVYDVEAIRDR